MRLDLHRHLEGSHSPSALCAVAARFAVKDPLFYDAAHNRYRKPEEVSAHLVLQSPSDDAMLFYECIRRARIVYVSEEAIFDLAERAFIEAAADCDGFEMRVSLFSMTRSLLENEGCAWRELAPVAFAERARRILLLVLAARDAAQRGAGKPMLVRVGFSRTFESEAHYRALAAMLREHSRVVCGLDVLGIVSGSDREPMPAALRSILDELRPAFPDLTVHAGEFEDHASVERTLALEPQGIGHGVNSVGSQATMERLAREGVTLEVCPTSNHLLIPTALRRLTELHGAAPLRVLQRAHVHCVLGSDDPTPMGTCYAREYATAESVGADLELLARDTARRWAQLPRPEAT